MMSTAVMKQEELPVVQQVAPVPVAHSEATALISMIERVALNPAVDIDKMKQLLDMQKEAAKERARIAFNVAMKNAQSEMPQVVRRAKNQQTNSRYAKLEAICSAITPIYTGHGFSLTFGTDVSPIAGCYRVLADCSHEEGHVKPYHADIPIDGTGMKGNANKTPTHAFGSTISYGRRYLTTLIFNVATTDDDDGNAAGKALPLEFITEEQTIELRELFEATGVDQAKFLAHFKIESLSEILVSEFEPAKKSVQKAASALQEGS